MRRFEEGWQAALARVQGWVDGFFVLLPNLIVGSVIFVLFVILAFWTRRRIARSFRSHGREDLGAMLASFALWSISLLGLLIGLTIILPTLKPADLVASLGVGSIAVGFAFKDILQNWLAGLLILLRQPFRQGDQIRVGEIEGTVQRINQRATLVRTFDNRMVVVPNADIYTSSITIMTAYPTRRLTLDMTVAYDHDVAEVCRIVTEALARLDEVEKTPAPQVLSWDLGATSLALQVRWWSRSQRASEIAARSRVVQAIKDAFQTNGIDPTDPQIVLTQRLDAPRVSGHPEGGERRVDEPSPYDHRRDLKPRAPADPVSVRVAPGDPEAEQPREPPGHGPVESRPLG